MDNTSRLTLHGTYSSNVAAYCQHHQCHLTVKQIREHECLSKNCWHMDKLEHPWWRYRENIKRIKKAKKTSR